MNAIVPTPPQGYRLLTKSERLQAGDKTWIDQGTLDNQGRAAKSDWVLVWVPGGYIIDEEDPNYYCRLREDRSRMSKA